MAMGYRKRKKTILGYREKRRKERKENEEGENEKGKEKKRGK